MNLAKATSIADLKIMHRRRVPRMFFDYAESGSWSEQTFRANEQAFERLWLKQRVAVDISSRQTATRMLGQEVRMPVALAPTGLTGMQHADGEILAARAARDFGVPFTLSTMSICSLEAVAEATQAPFWFQLYVMRDRKFIARLIERAKAAGCSALMLTVDLQILGLRHKDVKNGLSAPPKPSLSALAQIASKPAWALEMLRTKHRGFGNIVGHVEGVEQLSSLSAWSAEQLDASLTWEDARWVRDQWDGPLIVKGIMCAEDAALARSIGADAVVVSNHGGRQLDGAPASIDVLPEVVRAVGEDLEVWVDGGIRSGQDVVRALALGATSTLIGRAFLYGLGAAGEAGVQRALEIIHQEFDLTMAFCGITDAAELDGRVLLNQ